MRFPGKPVITSSGDQIKATVAETAALVVATVGAEPVAFGGYAAALLLDGDSLLRRENLRAGEDAVRRWFNAAALVRPASEGGLVVITADDAAGVGALLRWDPAGYASRELALRQELQLPPAVRVASVTGGRTAVGHFTDAIQQRLAAQGTVLRTAGPAPVILPAAAGAGRTPPRDAVPRDAVPGTPARRSGPCCSSPTPRPRLSRPSCGPSRRRPQPNAATTRCNCAWTASTSCRTFHASPRRRGPTGLQPFRLFPSRGRSAERHGLFGDGHEPPRRLIPAEVCGPLH